MCSFTLYFLHLHLEVFIAMSHPSGSRPLSSVTPSTMGSWDFLASVCCLGDPLVMDLQVCALLLLQLLTDKVDVSMGQLIALCGISAGILADFPHCPPCVVACPRTALASPPITAKNRRFCSQVLVPAHSHLHLQGQLHFLTQSRFRALSLNCCRRHRGYGNGEIYW